MYLLWILVGPLTGSLVHVLMDGWMDPEINATSSSVGQNPWKPKINRIEYYIQADSHLIALKLIGTWKRSNLDNDTSPWTLSPCFRVIIYDVCVHLHL